MDPVATMKVRLRISEYGARSTALRETIAGLEDSLEYWDRQQLDTVDLTCHLLSHLRGMESGER
jgi:hypothetical protein